MKGYKVVLLKRNNSLTSTFASNPVIYQLKSWAKPFPGDGPLACFDNEENARRFLGNCDPYRIYKCEYNISRKKKLYQKGYSYTKLQEHCPEGTVFASRIKLIEEV